MLKAHGAEEPLQPQLFLGPGLQELGEDGAGHGSFPQPRRGPWLGSHRKGDFGEVEGPG